MRAVFGLWRNARFWRAYGERRLKGETEAWKRYYALGEVVLGCWPLPELPPALKDVMPPGLLTQGD